MKTVTMTEKRFDAFCLSLDALRALPQTDRTIDAIKQLEKIVESPVNFTPKKETK